MQTFVGTADEVKALRDAIAQPIPIVDNIYDEESVRGQQAAISERNAAMDRLTEINKRQELLPKMLGRVRTSFASSVYEVFDSIANDHEGVDRKVFVDHLMEDGLDASEVKSRLKQAFDHLYDSGKSVGANEWKGIVRKIGFTRVLVHARLIDYHVAQYVATEIVLELVKLMCETFLIFF